MIVDYIDPSPRPSDFAVASQEVAEVPPTAETAPEAETVPAPAGSPEGVNGGAGVVWQGLGKARVFQTEDVHWVKLTV